ncbi:MAG: hypothetical protein V1885_03275 [Candidatus Brennerbacteria bacterium]
METQTTQGIPPAQKSHTVGILATIGVLVIAGIALWYGGVFRGAPSKEKVVAPILPPVGDQLPPFSPSVGDVHALTVPSRVVTSRDGVNQVKLFAVRAENGAFAPHEFVVMEGDRVQLALTAVADTYDLAIALPIGGYVVAEEGITRTFGFTASKVGTYSFACFQFCPKGAMEGALIIVPKG